MENKELYSYIVHSLDILNRSLTIHEQNTIKLFSYLYNNQVNIENNYNNLITNCVNKSDLNDTNKSVENLENCIIKFDNAIKKLENKINKIESKLKDNDATIIIAPTIYQDNSEISIKIIQFFKLIQKYCSFTIVYIKQLYNKCYRYIFRKRIQRELEEQERIYQEKLAEKLKQEEIERKRKIKEILNKTKIKK